MNAAMRFEINWKTVATEIARNERETNSYVVMCILIGFCKLNSSE